MFSFTSRLSTQTSKSSRISSLSLIARVTILALFIIVSLYSLVKAQAQDQLRLKPGFVGEPYMLNLSALVRGGSGNKTWSLVSGNLPPGLTLHPDGTLDGEPTTANNKNEFVVQATDSRANTYVMKITLPIKPFGLADASAALASAALPDPNRDKVESFSLKQPKPVACPTPQSSAFVMASSTADEETIALTQTLDSPYNTFIDPATLQIKDINGLIQQTLKSDPHAEFKKGDYCVIHIIKWKALKEEKSDPEKEMWALFEKVDRTEKNGTVTEWIPHLDPKDSEKQTFDNRIFGSRRVDVLLIHLNTPVKWDVKYKVTINQKTPQPITDLLQLAALVGGAGFTARGEPCVEPTVKDIWGARLMRFKYLASQMVVKVNTVTSDPVSGQQVEQSKEYSKSYENEGRYHWDVSIGLPVKGIKELEFTVDNNGTNSIVSTRKKERQNAYGFLNLFPWAVDLKGDSFLTSPHFLLGVPISGKPLDRPIIGVGTGIYKDMFKINLFAGAVFNRVREPRTLQVGEQATPGQLENDLRTRRVTKFVFGINFPLRTIFSDLGGKKQ